LFGQTVIKKRATSDHSGFCFRTTTSKLLAKLLAHHKPKAYCLSYDRTEDETDQIQSMARSKSIFEGREPANYTMNAQNRVVFILLRCSSTCGFSSLCSSTAALTSLGYSPQSGVKKVLPDKAMHRLGTHHKTITHETDGRCIP